MMLSLIPRLQKEEISKGVRELKLRKDTRNDSISNEIIRAGVPTILPFLVSFFNEILNHLITLKIGVRE